MNSYRKAQVALALARYARVPVDERLFHAHLQRDLGLEPLDIVLFALAFEESDDVEFRVEELEDVRTASELVTTVSQWLEQYDRNERLSEEEDAVFERPGAA